MNELLSLSGWLKKKGNVFGMKSRRYCTCICHTLFIFVDERSKFPEVTLNISNDTKIEYQSQGRVCRFTVWNSATENVELYPETKAELMRWVTVLKNAPSQTICPTFDDFKIIKVIGRGYYGKVMLVTKKESGEKYAIKSVHKTRLIQDKKSDTAFSERNILMKARHPFIVQLRFAFQNPSKYYLGLEYASGGELFERIKKSGSLKESEVRFYLSEIALAVSYLHSLGIIYRDLKPENILLDHEGHVKLTDFGLSKEVKSTEGAQTFCGTYEYVAPEIALGKRYGIEVDWWAIGILAFEMIMSVTPFYDKSQTKILEKIINDEVKIPKEIPPLLRDLISKLLIKDPSHRATFDDFVKHPFFDDIDWDRVYNRGYPPPFVPEESNEAEQPVADPALHEEFAMDSYGTPVLDENGNLPGFSFTGSPIDADGGERLQPSDLSIPLDLSDA